MFKNKPNTLCMPFGMRSTLTTQSSISLNISQMFDQKKKFLCICTFYVADDKAFASLHCRGLQNK